MVGGLIGALAAAVPGLIDLIYYKGGAPPVKNIALTHMAVNLSVVVLYAVNIWLRIGREGSMNVPFILSVIGVCDRSVRLARRANGARLWRRGRGSGMTLLLLHRIV